MKYSNYVIELKKENHTFLFNTKNNISLKIENKLLDKIDKDNHIKSEFESFLKSQDFDEKENELNKMIELFRKRDETTLRIIILAHGDCNFRCKYCYEKFSNCTITSQKTGIIDFVNQKLSEKNFEDCYAQKPNSYTIDTKGNLLKCTVSLYDEENKIGELGNSVINENNQKRWVHSYQFDSKCQKCQLLLVCKGGACPKRDIFNETSFEEKCFKMRRNIMNNFELSICSNNINYELKAD